MPTRNNIFEQEKPAKACEVNGTSVAGDWSEQTSLLVVLRKHLGLCATKAGCDNGQCGSCTILLDDQPVQACSYSWGQVRGKRILTVEGIPEDKRQMFAETFALAGAGCGFCVPGVAMRLFSLLASHDKPSRAMLQTALSQHICRCSATTAWLEAFQRKLRPGQPDAQLTLSHLLGESKVSRFDNSGCGVHRVKELLRGAPSFVDDVEVPDMLEGALAFVPYSWGNMRFVDTTRAELKPGVKAILTAYDIEHEGSFDLQPVDSDTLPSIPHLEKSSRANPETQIGLAEVVATSELLPSEDEGPSDVDDDDLPVVDSEETAALLGAALALWDEEGGRPSASAEKWEGTREKTGRKAYPWVIGRGDKVRCFGDVVALVVAEEREQAWAAADAVRAVIEESDPHFDAEYAFQRGFAEQVVHQVISRGDVEQAFRDAHTVVSGTWMTPSVDALTPEPPSCIAIPTGNKQMRIITAGSHPLAVQLHVARVLGWQPEQVLVECYPAADGLGARKQPVIEGHAALLAAQQEQPVKITLRRKDMSRLLPKRHSMRIHATLACDERGNFTGLRMGLFADTGGLPQHASEVLQQALVHACGPYRITAYQLTADAVCSNNPNAGELLSGGVMQVAFALESVIDMLSEHVRIDAWALRYRNALQPGDRLPNGQFLGEDCHIAAALEAVRDVYYKHGEVAGLACALKGSGVWHSSSKERDVRVQIAADSADSFRLLLPQIEDGRGGHHVMLRAICEVTGLPASSFTIEVGSQANEVLDNPSTQGSLSAMVQAVKMAAAGLKAALDEGESLVGLVFDGVHAFAVREDEPAVHPDLPSYLAFSYVAQVVVLDPSTGRIRRVVSACEVGDPLDLTQFSMQLEGAIHMGIGFALSEGLTFHEGRPEVYQPDECEPISSQYLPHFQTIVLTGAEGERMGENKAGGELGMIAVAPALASAISKREGVRHFVLPMRRSDTALAHRPPTHEGDSH